MKSINITIKKEEDFFEKYNSTTVSKDLLNYIIEKSSTKNITKLIIESKLKLDFKLFIKEGLKKELEKSNEDTKRINIMQIMLILLGTFFIFISVLLKKHIIWNEIVLIIGWVPIWEAIDIELFRDSKERKKRNIIKKLLDIDIEVHQK